MHVLRLLPIPVRLLVAQVAVTGVVLALDHRLGLHDDPLTQGFIVGVSLLLSGVCALFLSHSIVRPLTQLRGKLRECMEKETDHVFRDRGADEVAKLVRSVNDYVLYRDSDVQGAGRPAPAADGAPRPAPIMDRGAGLPGLLDFSRLLALDYDFGAAAHEVLAKTVEVMKLEWASVMTLDVAKGSMQLAASTGADPQLTESLRAGARPLVQFKPGEGVSGEVVASGHPLVLNKGQKDRRFQHFPRAMYHSRKVQSMVCVPVIVDGQVQGVANFFNIKGVAAFSDDHVAQLSKVVEVLSFLLAKSTRFQGVFRERLSGLFSPDYFRHLLGLEFERHQRRAGTISMVNLTLTYSEPVPDVSARQGLYAKVGEIVREGLRRVDFATRDQDAFLLCLPGTDSLGALFLAGRLKEKIDISSYEESRDRQSFTTAGGVASCPEHLSDPSGLEACAARALEEAIRTGDHRVVCATRVVERVREA